MDCYCCSKTLYSEAAESQTYLFGDQLLQSRRIHQPKPVISPLQQKLLTSLSELSQLWATTQIEQIEYSEIRYNPLKFYKKFVSKNCPCIIKGSIEGDDVIQRWKDHGYLRQVMQGRQVTVTATPDGFADSIKRDCFVEPCNLKLTMPQFFQYRDSHPGIEYIQNQNNSLMKEFEVLQYEYPSSAARFIGQQIFQSQPDACNFWMGRSESVSSMHKDPYQNLYQVVNGEKHFTLIPPIGISSLPEGQYKLGRWELKQDKSFGINLTEEKSRWISCNPDLKSQLTQFPQLEITPKFHGVVQEGDMLYLPSLWYHQVAQSTKIASDYIIAVNHWFDMEFAHNHTLYELTRAISGHTN